MCAATAAPFTAIQ